MPQLLDFGKVSSPEKRVLEITSFAGIDLSSAPFDIDKKRSPDAPNMMPDSHGNPIKRTGFEVFEHFGERINGVYKFGEHRIVHAGTKLYLDGELIRENLANEISDAQIIGNHLCLFDGKEALLVDENGAAPISEKAYVPTVLISKNADFAEKETVLKGDGVTKEFTIEHRCTEILSAKVDGVSTAVTLLENKAIFETAPAENASILLAVKAIQEPGGRIKEEFNLLSPRWKESFLCSTGTEKIFTLSKSGLSQSAVAAKVMDENGNWQEKTEGTDFTVDRENGKITFISPVLKTPIEGMDNLIIEAEKDFEDYPDKINLCKRTIAFDSGGSANRLFVCGNPNEPFTDRWCAPNDPTYWPDTYYSVLGKRGSEIVGYSVIGNLLAAYMTDSKDGRSVVIRKPELDENKNAVFPIEKHLQGEEALAPKSFVFMEKEQLFLTARGVYAVTTENLSGEKYTQNRSFFINRALCAEKNLKDAFCAKWKSFYVIAVGNKLYLLDTAQRSFNSGEPLSAWQYECYLWTGIDARVLWEENGALCFGDSEGNICRFTKDSYSDMTSNGKRPIEAFWTFPDFSGERFFRNKTVKTVAIQAAPYPRNRLRLEFFKDGKWNVLKEWSKEISYFAWNKIIWDDFTWSGNSKPRTLTIKAKIKKFDKCGFRITCDEPETAFGLYGFALEFSEKGRYKK